MCVCVYVPLSAEALPSGSGSACSLTACCVSSLPRRIGCVSSFTTDKPNKRGKERKGTKETDHLVSDHRAMTGCTVFALLLMIDNNVPIDRRDVLAVFGFAKACCPQCQPVPSLSLSLSLIQLDWLATLYRAHQ